MRSDAEMRVLGVMNATRGVPTTTSRGSRDSPRQSALALAVVALHRAPLLAAESRLPWRYRRRVVPLETSSEANLRFYGRLGFEVVDEVRIEAGPPVWAMLRAPKVQLGG